MIDDISHTSFTICSDSSISNLSQQSHIPGSPSSVHTLYDLTKICSALEKSGDDILADTESADWSYETEGHGEAALLS